MNVIYNERIKLLAVGVNNVAVATIVTATIAPLAGFLYGSPSTTATQWWPLIGIVWFLVGAGIHVVGQLILGRLKP